MKKPQKRRPAPDQDKIVVEALRGVGKPVSAYELMDQLRDKGLSAPPTVYRSLNRLIEDGRAHRLESLNAFVACKHDHADGHRHGIAVFAICENCNKVQEFDEPKAVELFKRWASAADFAVTSMTLELRGRCAECSA